MGEKAFLVWSKLVKRPLLVGLFVWSLVNYLIYLHNTMGMVVVLNAVPFFLFVGGNALEDGFYKYVLGINPPKR